MEQSNDGCVRLSPVAVSGHAQEQDQGGGKEDGEEGAGQEVGGVAPIKYLITLRSD